VESTLWVGLKKNPNGADRDWMVRRLSFNMLHMKRGDAKQNLRMILRANGGEGLTTNDFTG
jgi:hypothetical protein